MGGAVSGPVERARKVVVIRAYNARPKDQTVDEQFEALTKTDGGVVSCRVGVSARVGAQREASSFMYSHTGARDHPHTHTGIRPSAAHPSTHHPPTPTRADNGVKVIDTNDIKKAIGLTQPWFDELLERIAGDVVGEVVFNSFVNFLVRVRVRVVVVECVGLGMGLG